jgi:hypothetical protein
MSILFRAAGVEDTYATFKVFQQSIMDLSQRLGVMAVTGGQDPAVLERLWERRRSMFEHLARTAEHFWLAEKDQSVIGYARSIARDGVRELTDFFVLPGEQSAGVGRELLTRAFPADGATHRLIVSTIDARAFVRYLKSGVYPRFPSYYFSRAPEPISMITDLSYEPISASPESLDALGKLDKAILGYRRDVDHAWLLENRRGYLYYRGSQPVGYGYVGSSNGPFAMLDGDDFPAILAHAEREAVDGGYEFGVEVPMINRTAVNYLLARGFRLDSFFAFVMSDAPFGKFENYIFTSPPFFA